MMTTLFLIVWVERHRFRPFGIILPLFERLLDLRLYLLLQVGQDARCAVTRTVAGFFQRILLRVGHPISLCDSKDSWGPSAPARREARGAVQVFLALYQVETCGTRTPHGAKAVIGA